MLNPEIRKPRQMPSQGLDNLDGVYRTPMNMLVPVNRRWPIGFDLAGDEVNNAVVRLRGQQGYFYSEKDNALKNPWWHGEHAGIHPDMFAWLNPPFSNLGPWCEYARVQAEKGARFVMLMPAATGATWLTDNLLGLKIVFLIGRPVFEFINPMDHKNKDKAGKPNTDPYGKDLLLVVSDGSRYGTEWWNWRKG